MNDIAVGCRGLEKTFIQGEIHVNVLRGVDLTIHHGDCVAIVGASGSGKSTLLQLLGGLDEVTSGTVSVAGEAMSDLNEQRRGVLRNQYLGFVYQFHHLLPEFTALENVCMPLLIRGIRISEAGARAGDILARVGLADRLEHKPGELSGGERQRTAIARALVTRPRCILADEPTGNLDEKTARQVFDVMMELNTEYGTSLAMVTHNMALAERFGRVMQLREGLLSEV